MFSPNSHSFLLIRGSPSWPVFRISSRVFSPNAQSFQLTRSAVVQTDTQEVTTSLPSSLSLDGGEPVISVFLPNAESFYLTRSATLKPLIQSDAQAPATNLSLDVGESTSSDKNSGELAVTDKNKRQFLKVAGVAGVSLGASLLFPKKAQAFIMGSSPTTGVVGVKDAANARINPATEETLGEVLKTSDLTFDVGGALEVKVSSVSGEGSSSFSNVAGDAKSALVDELRHVQVDVLSSTLPSSASTENTLETISFGGVQYTLRLATDGDIDYVGEAVVGTGGEGDPVWRIKKIDSSSGIVIKWAYGDSGLNYTWTGYAGHPYS